MKRNSNLIWTVMGILSVFISSCSTGPTPLVTDQTEAPRDFTIATATPTQNIIPFQTNKVIQDVYLCNLH